MSVSDAETRARDVQELFAEPVLRCPHALFARLRAERPLLSLSDGADGPGVYLATRRADIEAICGDPETFSSTPDPAVYRWGALGPEFDEVFAGGGFRLPYTLVNSDPPKAQDYRRIVTEHLGFSRVAALEPRLSALLEPMLQALTPGVAVDFRLAVAVPFPIDAIGLVLGWDRSERDFVLRLTTQIITLVDPITPIETALEAARGLVEGQAHLIPKLEALRRGGNDGLLSAIANGATREGRALTLAESVSMAFTTIVAGNETSRNAILFAVFLLATRPDLWRRLQQDRSQVPAFVEEALRLASPAAVVPRTVTRDVELHGTRLPRGATVFIHWGSANRDERRLDRADEVDLDRPSVRGHLAFGFGLHHCAGLHLARKEIQLVVAGLLQRFAGARLVEGEDNGAFDPVFHVRQIGRLDLIFEA
jgi:cytochrome P450